MGGLSLTPRSETVIRPRVLFVVTEDWYFCSHRLPVARALRDAGWLVAVVCNVTNHADRIKSEGFILFAQPSRRGSLNPLRLCSQVYNLRNTLRAFKPDVVHNVALKSVLLGSLAALVERVPAVVNAIAGLGFVFSSTSRRAFFLRPVLAVVLRTVLRGSHIILQNNEDAEMLTSRGLADVRQISIIRGSGVDLERFRPTPEPPEPIRVVMISRLIEEKGVRDFVEAARILRDRGASVRMVLAGVPDPENPSSIAQSELLSWADSKLIDYRGFVTKTEVLISECHIAVLPSYYAEGVPLSLIEAAAAGRAMIACDRPGLRDVVVPGVSGILVPVKCPRELAEAIRELAERPELRSKYGSGARRIAEQEFAVASVVRATLAIYAEIAASSRATQQQCLNESFPNLA